MKTVSYEGLVERWKVDLISERARRMGFRPDEIPDVQQQIIMEVLQLLLQRQFNNMLMNYSFQQEQIP